MKKHLYKYIAAILAAVLLIVSFYLIFNSYFNLNIVQYSYNTKKCAMVLPEGNCKELPAKYIKEWVE